MSNMYEEVKRWIERDLCPFGNFSDRIEEVELDTADRYRFRFYTENNKYSIDVTDDGYLGCVVSSRKPRAGEEWTRGNDLPDGRCVEKTWDSIKNAIIRYEVVKLSKPVAQPVDETGSQRQMRAAKEIVDKLRDK